MRQIIANALGMEDSELAKKLAEKYIEKEVGYLNGDTCG